MMRNIIRELSQRRIAREAEHWVVRMGGSEMLDDEVAAFADWLGRSPEHELQFRKTSAVWQNVPAYNLAAAPPDRWIARFGEAFGGSLMSWAHGPRRIMVLACIVGLLAVVAVAFLQSRLLTPGVYRTVKAEQIEIKMPEGSTVQLNTLSEVHIDVTENVRLLRLVQGEAFFNVAHDPNRPFIVQVDGGTIRALGTKFNVRRDGGDTLVSVIEGTVEVKTEAVSATGLWIVREVVRGGQYVSYNTERGITQNIGVDVENVTSWRQGKIKFRNASLEYAVAEINRYRKIPITIADPELKFLKVSGSFNIDETDDFLDALASMNVVEVVAQPSEVVLLMVE